MQQAIFGACTESDLIDSFLKFVSAMDRSVIESALKDFEAVDKDEIYNALEKYDVKKAIQYPVIIICALPIRLTHADAF